MLILKQNAANTVPTPPAGKGTIFLNPSDDLAVKTADGTVTTFPTAGGSNTQVYFNDAGSFGANANFVFNKSTSVLTITGNVAATRVLTDNLLYANGTAWDLSDPGGANTQIQFNDDESFGGSAAFVFNKSSNLVTVSANLNSNNLNATTHITSGNVWANSGIIGALTLKGEGGNISNIQGGNVSGAVGSATTAGTVTTAAQGNITSVGTLTSLSVTGNISAGNVSATTFTGALSGAATTAGTVTTAAQPNITSTGTLTALTVTGNISAGNVSATTFTGALSGAATSATTAGTVTTAAQGNITSVGTLTSLGVSGTITASAFTANTGVFTGNGSALTALNASNVSSGTLAQARLANSNVVLGSTALTLGSTVTTVAGLTSVTSTTFVGALTGAATTAGTVTSAAQGNITSVGTLTGLTLANAAVISVGSNTNVGTFTGNFSLSAGSRLNATYADIAEKYVADATYEPGTVLLFGGEHEVTLSTAFDSTKVAGVVTTNPAYSMNSALEAEYVAEIALQGRVPVKVTGTIAKGDLLVSASNGHAVANNEARAGTIIGKSLENFTGESGVIEVAVGRF